METHKVGGSGGSDGRMEPSSEGAATPSSPGQCAEGAGPCDDLKSDKEGGTEEEHRQDD